MKSKSIYTLICLAATASLLNACSAGDDATAEQTPQATTVSFSGKASVGTSADATRGYFGDAAVGSPLGAYTWETGDVIKAAIFNSTAKTFLASGSDYTWDTTTTPSADGSSASVTWAKDLTNFSAASSNSHLLFSLPAADAANTMSASIVNASSESPLEVGYHIASELTGAAVNSMTHLKNCSFIYAQQDDFTGVKSSSDLQFHYIPALIRFAIANGNSSTVTITNVKMESSGIIFNEYAEYNLGSMAPNFGMYTQGDYNNYISVSLAATTPAVIEPGKYARIYTATLPTTTNFSSSTFTFTITTSDGTTYTSNKISGATLAAEWTNNVGSDTDTDKDLFREGKSYTFKLWLDNKKGLTFVSSSAMPGWGTDTGL